MGGGLLQIFGGASQSANDGAYDSIEQRADRAVEAVREHKHMDRPMPCGYIHFDMVEAVDASHEMNKVSYRFVKTFARQVFAACLSSCLLSGTGTGIILHIIQKRDQAREVKEAVQRAMAQPADPAAMAWSTAKRGP